MAELSEVYSVGLEGLKHVVSLLVLQYEIMDRPIKFILDEVKLVFEPRPEVLLVNAPVLELRLEHLLIVRILILAAIPYEVDHQLEQIRVPVDEDPAVVALIKFVPAGEHRFQCTSFYMAECGLANREVLPPSNIQLQYLILDGLYLRYLLFLFLPLILLFLQFLSLELHFC